MLETALQCHTKVTHGWLDAVQTISNVQAQQQNLIDGTACCCQKLLTLVSDNLKGLRPSSSSIARRWRPYLLDNSSAAHLLSKARKQQKTDASQHASQDARRAVGRAARGAASCGMFRLKF